MYQKELKMYPASQEQYINVSRTAKPGTIIQGSNNIPAGYQLPPPKTYKDYMMMNSGNYDPTASGPLTQQSRPPHPHGPTQQHYGPPHQHHGPPQQHYGPPQQHYGPPQQHHGPPQQHHGPPQQHYGPPQQHHGPPQQHRGPPPQLHVPPPQQVQTPQKPASPQPYEDNISGSYAF